MLRYLPHPPFPPNDDRDLEIGFSLTRGPIPHERGSDP